MKTTTIDTSLLPHIWLQWNTTKGTFFLDCCNGKKYENTAPCVYDRFNNPNYRTINSGSRPRFAYAKYHDDIEMLELAEVTIDTTRKEEAKKWRYSGEKYFLKKDKTVVDKDGNEICSGYRMSQGHYSSNFKGFLGMFYRISCPSNVEEFKKFLGSDTYLVGSGRCSVVRQCWQIQEWYKTKQKARGEGKEQKLTNELTKIPVRDVLELSQEYGGKIEYSNYAYRCNGIIYFERLSDGWSVLRVLNKSYDSNILHEVERMYLHDDGKSRIVSPSKDVWIPSRQSNGWNRYKFVNKDDAMEKCNRIKYVLPLIDDDNGSTKSKIMTILRFPEVEQMIRLNHRKAASRILNSNTPLADLKHMFGDYYNEKEKTILRKVGLTKAQFDKYMGEYEDSSYYYGYRAAALKEMRKFFGDSLVHLDSETFNKYYDAFSVICEYSHRSDPFYHLDEMDVDRNKFIKNAIRLGGKSREVYQVIKDTLNQYSRLNAGTHPEINWYFDSYSDVVRAHDAIDQLKREQDEERRAMWNMAEAERRKKEEEKRIKLDEERKKYEYEDDAYMIRLPKDYNEIIREGSMQRICIGGYTTDHALGHTNLFFIRKKSEPDIPFYAIEMANNNVIRQIHGFGNAWLGNHPEVIPTVVRWLRKNGIKCDEKILTCKARGYCSTNEYVPMPVVD